MRLAILSDLHLGAKKYRTEESSINKFEKAGYDIFNQAINKIIDYNPDLLLFCGDIFETPNPSILALSKFRRGLFRLKNILSLILLGNHDFSFTNRATGCSSVKAIIQNAGFNIGKFAEYDVDYYMKDNHLFILLPYVYDKPDKLEQLWTKCIEICNQFPSAKKILVTHGTSEHYTISKPEYKDRYIIPDKFLRNFDVVFIGHIHQPFHYTDNKTLVISPGALIDYQADGCYTGPLFFDTDTNEFYREILDSPHIIKKTLNPNTVNNFLKNVGPYIYKIEYDGDISAIDNDLFIAAKNKAINMTFTLATDDLSQDSTIAKLDSFYSWVTTNYPDKLALFREAQQELANGV